MTKQRVNRKIQWFVLVCTAPAAAADAVLLAIHPSAALVIAFAGALMMAVCSALLLFVCDKKPSATASES